MPGRVAHSLTSINAVSWTAIPAPINCDFVRCIPLGGVAVKWRSDSADPNTEETDVLYIVDEGHLRPDGMYRFLLGDPIVYAQSLSGSVNILTKGSR